MAQLAQAPGVDTPSVPTIVYVPEPERVWHIVEPLFKRALKHGDGEYWIEDVIQMLVTQEWRLVVVEMDNAIVAAVCVKVVDYPRLRALVMTLAGGSRLHEWAPAMLEFLDEGAKAVGAALVKAGGRPGWGRVFKKLCGAKTLRVEAVRKI